MIRKVLTAVDDSPAALAAARLAVDLAEATGGTVYAIAILPAHSMAGPDASGPPSPDGQRLAASAHAVLRHVANMARRMDVPVEVAFRTGDAAPSILDHARAVGADLIVVGVSGQTGPGEPYIGSVTRHVLEFTDCPVLVVPAKSVVPAMSDGPTESDPLVH